MLTADLVRVRTRGNELHVVALTDKTRPRAMELAERYDALTRVNLGGTYAELKEAWAGVELAPRDKKLALGLQKLIEDQLDIDAEAPIEPRKLRARVFLAAAAARRERPHDFDRAALLSKVRAELSAEVGAEVADLDDLLFADLKSQHRLRRAPSDSPAALVERYNLAQYQAVLLRATRVVAHVTCGDMAAYRELFRALKFRRLLYTILPAGQGYRIEIDGPFSLFEAVTKYGLQLALIFPRLLACEQLELEAQLRWGKARTPLTFKYAAKRPKLSANSESLPAEVADLIQRFRSLGSRWQVAASERILDLPGLGLVVPDLVFSAGGHSVYFELLGFWSREAVWKRVELVARGLPYKVLFGVSSKLRVSEAVLDENSSGALYVFKGVMNPKRVLERLEQLAR